MFKFLFIKRHKKRVFRYIELYYNDNEKPKNNLRYALPKEEIDNIRYSKSKSVGDSSEIKYSERDNGDNYNSVVATELTRAAMLNGTTTKPLSSVANLSFTEKLIRLIRERNMSEPKIYKAALMDRRLFSKIISNKDYKPSKDTVLALAFAMKLSLTDTKDLLDRAGFTLSHSILRDIILEYFIREHIYNLNKINAFLFEMGEKIIGRNI